MVKKKPLGNKIWFKVFLTVLIFLPSYTEVGFDPANTTDVIASVMKHPLIISTEWFLPIAKLLLLAVIISSFIFAQISKRLLLGYYTFILLIVGIFQNMAYTHDYGFVWLIGNTLIQFAVLGYCLFDVIKSKTEIKKENLNKRRLWIVVPMLLAFLMPYSINSENYVFPAFNSNVLINEAGVTYCMITPVVIGNLLLFSKGVNKSTLSVISYVGFIFGLLNMMTWFGLQIENWWMGVLHLPLMILSIYGMVVSNREQT